MIKISMKTYCDWSRKRNKLLAQTINRAVSTLKRVLQPPSSTWSNFLEDKQTCGPSNWISL